MSSIEIRKIGITKLDTDAIVNAANEGLWEGGGVCGYIFAEAGSSDMTKACQAIGSCKTGNAVITPGFKLPAKYVIHAVGPRWKDGEHNEPKLLYSAYKQSLILAEENGLHSIGFPLISAGIFGYPVDKAWRKALQACFDFMDNNPNYNVAVTFAVIDPEIEEIGKKTLAEIRHDRAMKEAMKESIDKTFLVDEKTMKNAYRWCLKNKSLFKIAFMEPEIRQRVKGELTDNKKKYDSVIGELAESEQEACFGNVLAPKYHVLISTAKISEETLEYPTAENLSGFSAELILAIITWHFRRDHFCEGSLFKESIADGYLMVLAEEFVKRMEALDV